MTLLKHNTDRVPKRGGYNPSVCQPTRTRQHKQLSCVVGQGWPCLKTGKRLNLPDKEESTATALTPFLVCVQPPPPPPGQKVIRYRWGRLFTGLSFRTQVSLTPLKKKVACALRS